MKISFGSDHRGFALKEILKDFLATKNKEILPNETIEIIDFGADNIRVNCICPGDVNTPMLYGEAVQLGRKPSEFILEAAERPLGRVGLPQDIANAVLYFASDLSSWTTGSILVVDGGGLA